MPDPIRQKITVDADDALKGIDSVARAEKKLAEEVEGSAKSTDAAADATKQRQGATDALGSAQAGQRLAERDAASAATEAIGVTNKARESLTLKQRAVESLSGAVTGLSAKFIGLVASGAAVIGFFGDITRAALEAVKAVAAVGESIRGLVANIGALQAKDVFEGITRIAGENRFDVQGRNELLQGISSLTDIKEGLTTEEILSTGRNLAKLQRATGFGGTEAPRLLIATQERLGVSEDAAVDLLTTALNSGFESTALQSTIEKGGDTGGLDFLSLILASRKTGLDINRATRSAPMLIAALTKTDESGNIAPELAGLGITENMALVDRIKLIIDLHGKQQISEGQFENVIGGAENRRFFGPFERAIQRDLVSESRAALLDPDAVERTIAELEASVYVRAQERQNLRQLAQKVRQERSGLTGFGEEVADLEERIKDHPSTLQWIERFGNLPSYINPEEVEAGAQRNLRDIRGDAGQGQTVIINNTTNIGSQINHQTNPYVDAHGHSEQE